MSISKALVCSMSIMWVKHIISIGFGCQLYRVALMPALCEDFGVSMWQRSKLHALEIEHTQK